MGQVPLCARCRTRPVEHRWRPFCSERCKMLDLARWIDGDYRIPGEPVNAPPDREADVKPGRHEPR